MEVRHKFDWGEVDPKTGQRQYPIHKAQADVLNSTARFTFAIAGTGGGKSVLIPLWLAQQIQKTPNGIFLLVIPYFDHFESSNLHKRFDEVFGGGYNATKHIYKVGTATIFIRSAEYPESIDMGIHAHAAAMDECGKRAFSYRVWDYVRARVDKNHAPVLGTTTPDANNWLYSEVFKSCDIVNLIPAPPAITKIVADAGFDIMQYNVERKSSDGIYYMRQWASILNTSYSIQSFADTAKAMIRADFERRYLGAFAYPEGLIYPDFAANVLDGLSPTAAEFSKHPAIRTTGGIDFGFDPDPAAVYVGVECQDNRLYLVEELYANKLSYDELAAHCRRLMNKWGVEIFYCDSSGKAAIHELKIRGIPASKRTIPDIDVGITMINARLRSDRLKIFPCCANLIEEAAVYARDKDNAGDFKPKPTDKFNHGCDSIRYLITGIDYGKPLVSKAVDLSIEDQQAVELKREVLLGRLPEDDTQRLQLIKDKAQAEEKERYVRWFNEKLHLDAGE